MKTFIINKIKKIKLSTFYTKYHILNYVTFIHKLRTYGIQFHYHDGVIKCREELLNSQRKYFTFIDFIKHAFRVARGASYIIFQAENNNHFVQFGLLED